jgi:hypothetical protein
MSMELVDLVCLWVGRVVLASAALAIPSACVWMGTKISIEFKNFVSGAFSCYHNNEFQKMQRRKRANHD